MYIKQIGPLANGGLDKYEGARKVFDPISQREESLTFSKELSGVAPIGYSIVEEISYEDEYDSNPYLMKLQDFSNSAGLTYSPDRMPQGFIK